MLASALPSSLLPTSQPCQLPLFPDLFTDSLSSRQRPLQEPLTPEREQSQTWQEALDAGQLPLFPELFV